MQITSPAPVETPVALKLEPSLVRVRDNTSGQFQVIVDNRQGIRPRRVTLAGTDPERALGFSFWPPVVEVGQGQIARATGRVDALPAGAGPRGHPAVRGLRLGRRQGGGGGRHLHPDDVTARPRRADDAATGTQHRPGPQQRRRIATVYADNRGGSRPRRVQFGGHDPERVVRFAFNPPVIDLAPGQAARSRCRSSRPRPDGGEEVTRPFTVVASDGARDTEATGSFVQESSDRRPLWRILLTVLGAILMIAGVFLAWNGDAPVAGRSDIAGRFGDQVSPNITGFGVRVCRRYGVGLRDDGVDAGAGVHANCCKAGSAGLGRRGGHPACGAGPASGLSDPRVGDPAGGAGRRDRAGRFRSLSRCWTAPGGPSIGVFVVFAGCVLAFIGGAVRQTRAKRLTWQRLPRRGQRLPAPPVVHYPCHSPRGSGTIEV